MLTNFCTDPQPCPANPPLVNGVETDEDRYFFDHFFSNISYKLSCRNDGENPFVVLLMPMALEHQGLMHSILALSGSHLMIREPAKYENRRFHHYSRAIQILSETIAKCNTTGNNSLPDDPTVASTLIMCVNTVCEGDTNGMYRPHLDGIGELVRQRLRTLSAAPGKASAFSRFLIEFFLYHDTLRSMTGLDRRPSFFGNLELPNFMDPKRAGSLIGVIDGLFNIISKITKLRDQLRSRGLAGKGRGEDFETTSEALSIDSDLRQWTPSQPPGHPHYHGAQVYRQCVCIYLFRTIMPSQKHPTITQAVDVGLDLLQQTQASTGIESILLMPIFILGCAAFDAEQRPVVSQYFDTVQEWSSLGNVGPTRAVVERIWQLMDAEDPLSWDWETVMRNMGYDFLIA